MARLIVCCDGTWNTPDQEDNGVPAPTNVYKLHSAIAAADHGHPEQESYYREGVGTSGNVLLRVAGGALGARLSDDIQSAYMWLCKRYRPGDEIFLFGFSRGAFSVRSLAGLMCLCGLFDFRSHPLEDKAAWEELKKAYKHYREKPKKAWVPQRPSHPNVPIHFLGVWDTVGALGIPDELFLNFFDRPDKWQFHNTVLNEKVKCARHAVAMDERRQAFAPTLWSDVAPGRDVEETWFAGVHGDVGGSYARTGLGDLALQWMMDAAGKRGLVFRDGTQEQLAPSPQGVQHDSVKGVFKRFRTRPRTVPCINEEAKPAEHWRSAHPSVLRRQANPPLSRADYWPTRRLVDAQDVTRQIFAREQWNATGLYLEAGVTYALEARGEWLDAKIRATPDGLRAGFSLGKIAYGAASPFSALQRFRLSRDNPAAATPFAKRDPSRPWMSLIGVIANGEGVQKMQLVPHQTFFIGSAARQTPERGGYLYCYANDAWRFYFNNRGKVDLTVRRVDGP
ncbi:MAG: DUF2235 domain-containing protein [Pseudomonadota bacterium]